jgi:hypothetical protein
MLVLDGDDDEIRLALLAGCGKREVPANAIEQEAFGAIPRETTPAGKNAHGPGVALRDDAGDRGAYRPRADEQDASDLSHGGEDNQFSIGGDEKLRAAEAAWSRGTSRYTASMVEGGLEAML